MNISRHPEFNEQSLDPDSIAFVRLIQRQALWHIFSYGEWIEPSGAKVVFDRQYRPICRVHVDGPVEIVSPDTWITFTAERFYHGGFGPRPDAETRSATLEIMLRYGLELELRRRRKAARGGTLPRWATRPIASEQRLRPVQ
jgi:hypothetical protein